MNKINFLTFFLLPFFLIAQTTDDDLKNLEQKINAEHEVFGFSITNNKNYQFLLNEKRFVLNLVEIITKTKDENVKNAYKKTLLIYEPRFFHNLNLIEMDDKVLLDVIEGFKKGQNARIKLKMLEETGRFMKIYTCEK